MLSRFDEIIKNFNIQIPNVPRRDAWVCVTKQGKIGTNLAHRAASY